MDIASKPAVDQDQLMAFVMRAVDEAGAALNCALVVMGDRLGYYRSLVEHGPSTPAELAQRTGTDEHYAREWLNAQAAGQFVEYDAASGRYFLSPEQATALADESSPAFVIGLFQTAHGTARDATKIFDAAATGAGMSWGTTIPTSTSDANDSSGPPMRRTWSRSGCRRSMESPPSWPAAPGWPTSAVGTVPPPS